MRIPEYVKKCIDTLEAAGFAAYAVGGCVRDSLLGLEPHDFDLCSAATPDQTEELFKDYPLVLAGKKHGTVAVVTGGDVVEITTFRTEGDYRDSRHPEWVRFVADIEGDLARRDFTINAMAWSPHRGFADPFGGRADLENHVLRAVGDPEARFREDALRILRGARFAAKYRLTPEARTKNAMFALTGLMDNLARERVFDELCKLLLSASTEDLLRFAPVVTAAIPELKDAVGFDQRSPHHSYDIYTHTAHVVEAVPAELPLRWAALLHDVGKVRAFTQDETGRGHFYGHAKISAEMADSILRRLKAPTALRERVVFLIEKHMTPLTPDRKLLRRRLSQFGIEATHQQLRLQTADFNSKGVTGDHADFAEAARLLEEIEAENSCLTIRDLAVNGHDLMAMGCSGREVGNCLEHLLSQVLDETIENTKDALLAEAGRFQIQN